MSVSVEETQNELAQLFPNIETEAITSFNDFLKYITHPGVSKLTKLAKYLRMITKELRYESGFHSIKIYIDNPEKINIKPWGTINIETYSLKITIYNDFEENEPVFIEIKHKFGHITVGFYGRVEIDVDVDHNNLIRIEPKSKVYVFSR